MDQMIRRMLRLHDPVELAQSPDWMELVELYDAMKKMLPAEYLASMGGYATVPISRRRRRKWQPKQQQEQRQQQRLQRQRERVWEEIQQDP